METIAVHPLISWRSVIAGLFVSLLTYIMITALGVAMGAASLVNGLETTTQTAGIAAGLWIIGTTAVSLFCGAYFAARISRYPARVVGSAQGVLIASLFFAILVFELAATLGIAGRAVGSMVSTAGSGVSSAAASPQVQDVIQEALEGLNLKSEPKAVIEGVAVRLVQGDSVKARDFLARQTGLTPAEAEARINSMREQVQETLSEIGEQTARTLSAAAWILFGLMAVGLLAAVGGGVLGTRTNFRHPIMTEELVPTIHATRSAS